MQLLLFNMVCPKQGPEIEGDDAIHRISILGLLFALQKQGQGFVPSVAPLYQNIGQVPPTPGTGTHLYTWVE